jgi:hypothetical protein
MFRRQIIQTLNRSDYVVAFKRDVDKVRSLESRVRKATRFRALDGNLTDVDTEDRAGIAENGLRQMAFAASEFQN